MMTRVPVDPKTGEAYDPQSGIRFKLLGQIYPLPEFIDVEIQFVRPIKSEEEVPPVDRSCTVLTDGKPVPEDRSHTKQRPDGQQEGYEVLCAEERAKGFVRPVRTTYVHVPCGGVTTMGVALAETYARDPNFYSGTFCVRCRNHFPLKEFVWDGTNEVLGS